MTRFCLVRHGQTDWNLQGRWQGHTDIPLNQTGRKQAFALATQLADVQFDAIFCSDLSRAKSTARLVARSHSVLPKVDPRLREINLGEWEGKLSDDVPRLYPLEWAARLNDPIYARPPGGESVFDLAQRSLPVLEQLCSLYPLGSVLIVSHGLLLALFLCHLRGLPLQESFNQIPPNASPLFVEMK
jgi:alpha-ribazole phosphatase